VACLAQAEVSPDAVIELHLDRVAGPLIGTLPVPDTGGRWKIATTAVTNPTGIHDLFLVFKGATAGRSLKTDYWQFTRKATNSSRPQ